jgi:hypothetical protein
MGATSKAQAATFNKTHLVGMPKNNPLVPDYIEELNSTIASIKEWWHNLPQEIAEGSINLMAWLYDLSATLILKTPLWIFNNEWFENTTYMFSMLSIGLVSVLTIVEALKRMVMKMRKRKVQPMDMKEIMKRWFIVAGLTTAVPFLFQKAFQGLNKISDFFISMGAETMRATALPTNIAWFDVLTLTVFDIVLISTIVPVLWKNGRRFFDIMVLGVISPLALTAWIFDPYKHWFKQWWDNLKHLSLVQVYYSLFLLILGWFIFGVPTPAHYTGLIVKLLVVIGGFARMVNPPRLINKHLDSGGGFDEVYGSAKGTTDKVKKNFVDSAKIIMKPHTAIQTIKSRLEKKAGGKKK